MRCACWLPPRLRDRRRVRRLVAALARPLVGLLLLPAMVTHRQLTAALWQAGDATYADRVVVLVTPAPPSVATTSMRGRSATQTPVRRAFASEEASGVYRRDLGATATDEAPVYRRVRGLPPPSDALRIADYVQAVVMERMPWPRGSDASDGDWVLRPPVTDSQPWALVRRHDGTQTMVAEATGGSSVCGTYRAVSTTNAVAAEPPARASARVVCGPLVELLASDQQREQEPAWMKEIICETPATALLIGLNCLLWFLYWNYRTDPSAVAMSYSAIVRHGEAWRALSGATAHFEPWHLLFNMSALYGLGRELEGRLYSSLAFLLWNLSLLPLTALVWCGLHRLRRGLGWPSAAARGNVLNEPEDHWTVGYSGVLFAWMVVASLRQAETCPVFFLPSLCFRTFHIAGTVPFSIAPLMQLAVAQIVLPRVSFLGHLAGLTVGFLMHWGMLPLAIVQPAISIPMIYLLYLKYTKKIMPRTLLVLKSFLMARDECFDKRLHIAFLAVSVALYLICFRASTASLLFPSLITCIFWIAAFDDNLINGLEQVVGRKEALVRSFVAVAALTLVNDSMALGAWFVVPASWTAWLVSLLLARFAILLGGVCRACLLIPISSQGILGYCLGWTILEPCRQLGEMCNCDSHDSIYLTDSNVDSDGERSDEWAPFTGQGRVLGLSGIGPELLQHDPHADAS